MSNAHETDVSFHCNIRHSPHKMPKLLLLSWIGFRPKSKKLFLESLRKHAHAIHRDFKVVKNENFQLSFFFFFHIFIFAQNIDCWF